MDLTFTLGDVATIISIILGTLAVYTRLIERLARIETKVDTLWRVWTTKQLEP